MENRLEKQILIAPSMCDSTARLGVPNTFSLFMDLASEHAETLGLGSAAMQQRGLFWLTVRTRVRFYSRPALMDTVTAATWPGQPGKMRCLRYYTLSAGATRLAEGKTEWAVMETDTGRLHALAGLYPAGLALSDETACNEPFDRIDEDFPAAQAVGDYTVRSTDIDLGGHMNNAAYVHALIGTFSNEALAGLAIREMDVCFRAPCYEGELLSIRRRQADGGPELALLRPEGKPAVLSRIRSSAGA